MFQYHLRATTLQLARALRCCSSFSSLLFILSVQTPGEFGNLTLCTDPSWHTALLAFKWLGLPFEVEHDDVSDGVILDVCLIYFRCFPHALLFCSFEAGGVSVLLQR